MDAPKLFISYSTINTSFLQELAPLLREVYGLKNVWYDAQLVGGQDWWNEILTQIEACDIFLYLVSSSSVKSQYCKAEFQEALRLQKRILPTICERTAIPNHLSRIQFIDLSDGIRIHSFAKLVAAINGLAAELPDTPLPPLNDTPTPLPEFDQEIGEIVYEDQSLAGFEYDEKLHQILDKEGEDVVRRLSKVSRLRVKENLRRGQSGSAVLLVDVDPILGSAFPVGPHYLKVHSDAEDTYSLLEAIEEIKNTSIQVAMPDVVDYAVFDNRLAVLYTPAQKKLSARDVISLGELLERDISLAIQHIQGLCKLLMEWNKHPRVTTITPYNLLVDLLGHKRVYGESNVQKRVFDFLQISDEPKKLLLGGELLLPNPISFLSHIEHWEIAEKQSITIPTGHIHGDLHANNLICQRRKDNRATSANPFPDILDFATYNSDKIVFFDFAYLEFDILIRLYPFEQKVYRREMIRLLPHIMSDEDLMLDQPIPGGHFARIIPDLLKPIRANVQHFFGSRSDDYSVAFWLSCIAVGLNFARKRTSSVSHYDNLFGVMYAAAALDNVLRHFGIEVEEETVPSIAWIDR